MAKKEKRDCLMTLQVDGGRNVDHQTLFCGGGAAKGISFAFFLCVWRVHPFIQFSQFLVAFGDFSGRKEAAFIFPLEPPPPPPPPPRLLLQDVPNKTSFCHVISVVEAKIKKKACQVFLIPRKRPVVLHYRIHSRRQCSRGILMGRSFSLSLVARAAIDAAAGVTLSRTKWMHHLWGRIDRELTHDEEAPVRT